MRWCFYSCLMGCLVRAKSIVFCLWDTKAISLGLRFDKPDVLVFLFLFNGLFGAGKIHFFVYGTLKRSLWDWDLISRMCWYFYSCLMGCLVRAKSIFLYMGH